MNLGRILTSLYTKEEGEGFSIHSKTLPKDSRHQTELAWWGWTMLRIEEVVTKASRLFFVLLYLGHGISRYLENVLFDNLSMRVFPSQDEHLKQ